MVIVIHGGATYPNTTNSIGDDKHSRVNCLHFLLSTPQRAQAQTNCTLGLPKWLVTFLAEPMADLFNNSLENDLKNV